jgi:hypothetical protein
MKKLLTIALLIANHTAHSAETCQTTGKLTHCWDSNTGALHSTIEQSNSGYSHTWTPQGENFTTWDHNGLSNTWRTK